MTFAATHIGTATLLLEVGSVRLLTAPAFDPPGRTYGFGWGTRSKRTAGPALPLDRLGRLDGVLLSHDQHADNLDDAASEAVTVAKALGASRIVPVHYDGWTHFRQKPEETLRVFTEAGLGDRVQWLVPGERTLLG
jgi:L-ascorbate metabolism protein UlaG (beta-lactamase superfamily)